MKKYDFRGYEIVVAPITEDGENYVMARMAQFPSCMVIMDNYDDALAELEVLFEDWIDSYKESGETLPPPMVKLPSEYTGRLTVRMPSDLHQRVAESADRQGVSLNQYISHVLSYHEGFICAGRNENPTADNIRRFAY